MSKRLNTCNMKFNNLCGTLQWIPADLFSAEFDRHKDK